MHGNVWEWVWDGYRSDYENLPQGDPVYDVGPGASRVLRGGHWNNFARDCRSARRSLVGRRRAAEWGTGICDAANPVTSDIFQLHRKPVRSGTPSSSCIVFQHRSIEGLRRELKRNGQLRWICGFDLFRGVAAVPPSYVYTRFLQSLYECQDLVDRMFNDLVAELQELLPDFGNILAIDGKAIKSHGNPRGEDADNTPDGRRDLDATWGVKTYKGKRDDGTAWSKTKSWFGYRLHLIADATYELPVACELASASPGEQPAGLALAEDLAGDHPDLIKGCDYLLGDKGYDVTDYHVGLWDDYGIKCVIDIRNLWKDGEQDRIVTGFENVTYDYQGTVYCYCMKTGERQEMAFGGFEKDRECLKYRCPAKHYGMKCRSLDLCRVGHSVRIKLSEDRRVFTPVARSSYLWKNLYKKRTAVERVNGRLDTSFGFEDHYI